MQNDRFNVRLAAREIADSTVTGFTICVLCWSLFWLLPDWHHTGAIGIREVVSAIWVSLGTCLCMSVWGFLCFSDAFAKKAGRAVRYLAFAVIGYGIIAAWVFGSGWCPPGAFPLFTIICIAALAIAGIAGFVGSKREDARLNERLHDFKQS